MGRIAVNTPSSVGAECLKCGHNRADIHFAAVSEACGVTIHDGYLQVSYELLSRPDSIQIEAICSACGIRRYLAEDQWGWA